MTYIIAYIKMQPNEEILFLNIYSLVQVLARCLFNVKLSYYLIAVI